LGPTLFQGSDPKHYPLLRLSVHRLYPLFCKHGTLQMAVITGIASADEGEHCHSRPTCHCQLYYQHKWQRMQLFGLQQHQYFVR